MINVQPPDLDEFELRSDGTIRLKSRLNYNTDNLYTFIVEAKVNINPLNIKDVL